MKKLVHMINEVGTHAYGIITRKASAALVSNRFAKLDGNGKVAYAGANDKPLALIQNNIDSADDQTSLELLCASKGTKLVTAAGVVAVGDEVCPAADGKAQTLPAAAGTYYIAARALTAAAADGDVIEVETFNPVKTVVTAG